MKITQLLILKVLTGLEIIKILFRLNILNTLFQLQTAGLVSYEQKVCTLTPLSHK